MLECSEKICTSCSYPHGNEGIRLQQDDQWLVWLFTYSNFCHQFPTNVLTNIYITKVNIQDFPPTHPTCQNQGRVCNIQSPAEERLARRHEINRHDDGDDDEVKEGEDTVHDDEEVVEEDKEGEDAVDNSMFVLRCYVLFGEICCGEIHLTFTISSIPLFCLSRYSSSTWTTTIMKKQRSSTMLMQWEWNANLTKCRWQILINTTNSLLLHRKSITR